MKRCLLSALTFLSVILGARAQGEIDFTNFQPRVGLEAPVFNVDGTPLEGDRFVAQLLGGPNPDSMEALGEPVPFRMDGLFVGGTRVVPGPLETREVAAKVRAWDTTTGSSFDEATVRGMSSVLTIEVDTPRAPPAALRGLESFSLVPEPSVWGLSVVALLTFALCRRRPRKPQSG